MAKLDPSSQGALQLPYDPEMGECRRLAASRRPGQLPCTPPGPACSRPPRPWVGGRRGKSPPGRSRWDLQPVPQPVGLLPFPWACAGRFLSVQGWAVLASGVRAGEPRAQAGSPQIPDPSDRTFVSLPPHPPRAMTVTFSDPQRKTPMTVLGSPRTPKSLSPRCLVTPGTTWRKRRKVSHLCPGGPRGLRVRAGGWRRAPWRQGRVVGRSPLLHQRRQQQ